MSPQILLLHGGYVETNPEPALVLSLLEINVIKGRDMLYLPEVNPPKL